VNSSPYAEFFGIPIALIGAISYLIMIGLLLTEDRGKFWTEYNPILMFGLTLSAVIYSIYLTYLEIAVLRAVCPYCVLSAAILVVLLVLSSLRLWRGSVDPSLVL
jgi:uncharacterized membrane protein